MLDVDLQKLLATFAATFGKFCSNFWQILQQLLQQLMAIFIVTFEASWQLLFTFISDRQNFVVFTLKLKLLMN